MPDGEETGIVESAENVEVMVVELPSDVVMGRIDLVVFVVASSVGTERFWYSLSVSWLYCVFRGSPLLTMSCNSATQRTAVMKNATSTGTLVINGRYCFLVLLGISAP